MDTSNNNEIVIPALLRGARSAYSRAIHAQLAAVGCEDVPRNGSYVLGGMASHGFEANDLIQQLGVSKQAASQLIDTMVVRGYLERRINPDDRRRMTIELTEHGRAAAAAIRTGVESVDAKLRDILGAEGFAQFRFGLAALADLGWREGEEG
jgi:DNA-binding MarR family transcriptional regulator